MTTVTPEPTDTPIEAQLLDGAVEEYPRDKLYVITAVFLAIITGIEIMTYVAPELPAWNWGNGSNAGIITVLMVLMAVKFFTVAYVFMHLKFDNRILTWIFYSGLALAVAVYLVMMFMFRMFSDGDQMVRQV